MDGEALFIFHLPRSSKKWVSVPLVSQQDATTEMVLILETPAGRGPRQAGDIKGQGVTERWAWLWSLWAAAAAQR